MNPSEYVYRNTVDGMEMDYENYPHYRLGLANLQDVINAFNALLVYLDEKHDTDAQSSA